MGTIWTGRPTEKVACNEEVRGAHDHSLTVEIKEQPPKLAQLPIIIVTAVADVLLRGEAARCTRSGPHIISATGTATRHGSSTYVVRRQRPRNSKFLQTIWLLRGSQETQSV